jgi:hypothetical protein
LLRALSEELIFALLKIHVESRKMNTQLEPPPKRGMGLLGKGCLILIALGILLVVVGVGGSLWTVRQVYLSDKPTPIPEATAPTETNAGTPATAPTETKAGTPGEASAPAAVERSAEVRERLDTMKQAARAHEETDMELTAADINALIWANRKSRGMASVGIDGNVLQAQFSIPLERLDVPFRNAFGLSDRYLIATVTIVAPPGTNASNVQLSEVKINGHSVPGDVLDWGLPGVGQSLRTYVVKYANQYGVTGGEIRDGKVILHTSGH